MSSAPRRAADGAEAQACPGEPGGGGTGPVRPEERIKLLDVLRGFALLGVLLVNWNTATGRLGDWITFLAEGSFYPMFSFLFGLGFALQLLRAAQARRPFVVRYVWRSVLLLAIGFVHASFLFGADILRSYATLAIVLLVARRWHPRMLVAVAAASLLFTASPTSEYLRPGRFLMRADPEQAGVEFTWTQEESGRRQAQVAAITDRVPGLPRDYRQQLTTMIPYAVTSLAGPARPAWWKNVGGDKLCMFLLGLWAGRRRILQEPHRHLGLLLTVGTVGLIVGVLGNGVDTFGDAFERLGITQPAAIQGWTLAYELGNIGLTFFYLATLTLLYTRVGWAARVLGPLGWVGWLALTNYLLQSVVFNDLLPFGFGDVLVLFGFFGLQVVCSGLWLRWFRFGPVEWLWRSLTWWRWQPMRRSIAQAL